MLQVGPLARVDLPVMETGLQTGGLMSEPGQHRGGRGLIRVALGLLSLAFFLGIGCRSVDLGFNVAKRIDPRADLTATSPQTIAPTRFTYRVAPYIFFSDFDLDQEKGLLEDLGQLRDRLSRHLQLPVSSATIQVYLFENQERYTAYLSRHHKNLPERRALFVRQQRIALGNREDLLIYTYRTDRLAQDLRHELTHALLHSVLREVPLWLDEGLAEYFELPLEQNGVNPEHVRLLRNAPVGQWKPDLPRLETLTEVPDMKLPEYRESWAWVHLMLHGKPEGRRVLLAYLHHLKDAPAPGPFAPRLAEVYPDLAGSLQKHLEQLEIELARRTSKP